MLCVIVALTIWGISKGTEEDENSNSDRNNSSALITDVPTSVEDEESVEGDVVEDEIDLWIEPSNDTAKESDTSTTAENHFNQTEENIKEEKIESDFNKKEDNEEENKDIEDDSKKEESKPEWIGGDF